MNSTYIYTAKNSPGPLIKGTLVAASFNDALLELMRRGLVPVDICARDGSAPGKVPPPMEIGGGLGRNDIAVLIRQLANLTQCDLPVVRCLRLIAKRAGKRTLKEMLKSMIRRIEDGAMLSEAMTDHPGQFSSTYVHMIKSGEIGGQLGDVLKRAADFIDEDAERVAKIRAALYYPLFVLGVGIFTITVMLTFVIPRMSGLFEEFQTSLPLPTRLLLAVSHGLRDHGLPVMLMTGAVIYFFNSWVRSPEGRIRWDMMLMRLPLYGNFIYQTEMTRILRTLGMLLENGVEMITALSAARDIVGNSVIKDGLKSVLDDVKAGSGLSKALSRHKIFDEAVVGLVHMGEESGDLPRSLNQLAVMHERETSEASTAFLSLLGPALLVVIVGFTGFVVTALLLPMVQMDILVR